MVILINPNEKSEVNIKLIKDKLKHLAVLLTKHKIVQKREYMEWSHDFRKVYGNKQANLDLYCVFSLLYFIGYM